MSVASTTILPFCDEIGISTEIANLNGDSCPADVLLRISFGTPTESNTNATLLSFNYLGNLTLANDDFWFDGQNTYRRFSLLVSGIPDTQSVMNLVRFSLTPDSNFLDPTYIVLVDVVPQDAECGEDPEGNVAEDNITIAFSLTEPPINGLVSELIIAGRLLNNSSTNPIVERKTIRGTLEVDDDYFFDGPGGLPLARPRLYLDSGAKILVKQGHTLTLTNADIFTCSELAAGIEVETGAALVASGCVFNDARFAINAKPGSAISLSGNSFFDNYIGLNLDMSGGGNNQRVNLMAFDSNTFATVSTAIKSPYAGMPEPVESRGFCGIRLYDYRDFNVFGGATFARLANGIVGYNSTGNIGNMTFDDMNTAGQTAAYPFEGFGIRLAGKSASHWFNINEFWTNMTFDSCKTGIFANSYALNVENATMTNVEVGIDVANSRGRDIILDGNTITARKYGIRSGLNEPVHHSSVIRNNEVTVIAGLGFNNGLSSGIELNETGLGYIPSPGQTPPLPAGTDGWQVEGNTVTMREGGVGILYRNGFAGALATNTVTNLTQPGVYQGILAEGTTFSDLTANTVTQAAASLGTSTAIQSSGGFANTYQCNCVDNTDIGMLFRDLADFTDAVRGNNFNEHCTGLQIDPGAYIGVQSHRGNLWDLGAIGGSCLGGRNYSSVLLSPFFVDGNDNAALNPEVWPDEEWFTDESGTTFDDCATCAFPPQKPPRIVESDIPTKLDEYLATDKLFPELFEDEMNWKGAYRLYRKMLRHPSIESYATEFEDFKTANDSLSTGRLAYIAEEKVKIFSLSGAQDTILENFRLAWHTEMGDLRLLDSLRHAGDTTISYGQYDTVVQFGIAALSQYALYLDTLAMDRRAKIQNLIALNTAVNTTLVPDGNHKTVNNIVLSYLLTDTLASGDLTTLEGIAEQCPLEGGDAVYEARAIVAYLTGASFDDEDICALAEERHQAEKPEKATALSRIVLYPNPTTGLLTWSGIVDQTVILRIYNSLGQLQMEQDLSGASTQIGHLPGGLYQIQLLDSQSKAVLSFQKVLLVKH